MIYKAAKYVTRNPWVSIAFGIALMWVTAFALHKHSERQETAYQRSKLE